MPEEKMKQDFKENSNVDEEFELDTGDLDDSVIIEEFSKSENDDKKQEKEDFKDYKKKIESLDVSDLNAYKVIKERLNEDKTMKWIQERFDMNPLVVRQLIPQILDYVDSNGKDIIPESFMEKFSSFGDTVHAADSVIGKLKKAFPILMTIYKMIKGQNGINANQTGKDMEDIPEGTDEDYEELENMISGQYNDESDLDGEINDILGGHNDEESELDEFSATDSDHTNVVNNEFGITEGPAKDMFNDPRRRNIEKLMEHHKRKFGGLSEEAVMEYRRMTGQEVEEKKEELAGETKNDSEEDIPMKQAAQNLMDMLEADMESSDGESPSAPPLQKKEN